MKFASDQVNCNGDVDCGSIKRIKSLLKYYMEHHNNFEEVSQYLQQYKIQLIKDYHHILDKHLNEERMTKMESNKQFQMIHEQMADIQCNIKNCEVYLRNNRQRETMNIQCNDKNLAMLIDIIDTIHCYFIHSIDVGYRIINSFNHENEMKSEETDDNDNDKEYDAEMKRLREYISSKRAPLQKIRGNRRVNNSKFMTQFSGIVYFFVLCLLEVCFLWSYNQSQKRKLTILGTLIWMKTNQHVPIMN